MQQLVVGNIVEGKVTGITKFGAFVDLGDGKTGMVHISEVAPTFVKEIRDFVKENDTVKVKILSISEDGKISLSMKKAEPQQAAPAKTERPARPKRTAPPRDMGWRGPKPTPEPQRARQPASSSGVQKTWNPPPAAVSPHRTSFSASR